VGQPRLPLELARRSVSGAQRGRPRRSAIEALPREHTRVERANPSGANAQLMRTALGLFIFRREPKLGNTMVKTTFEERTTRRFTSLAAGEVR
jgi:hypothetical protein